jgi:hypothetical protein
MDVGAVWHWAKHVNKADGVRRSGPAWQTRVITFPVQWHLTSTG